MGADVRPARGPGGGRPPARPRECGNRRQPAPAPRAEPDAARPAPGPTGGALGVPAGPHLPHPAPRGGASGGARTPPLAPLGLLTAPLVFIPPGHARRPVGVRG